MREVHSIAIFVHGMLAALHSLGAVYNIKRRNRWQTVAHLAGIAFSVDAAIHHCREAHK